MFTIHDTRITGCPAITRAATPEGAWALVDALGIPRGSALVLPVGHEECETARESRQLVEQREAAEAMEQIPLLVDALTVPMVVTPATSEAA